MTSVHGRLSVKKINTGSDFLTCLILSGDLRYEIHRRSDSWTFLKDSGDDKCFRGSNSAVNASKPRVPPFSRLDDIVELTVNEKSYRTSSIPALTFELFNTNT